jgi:hypothetical protein
MAPAFFSCIFVVRPEYFSLKGAWFDTVNAISWLARNVAQPAPL